MSTRPTRDTLNSVMEFDHVIHVHDDGTVTEPRGVWAPELRDGKLSSGHPKVKGWALMGGYSGQYGYSGPIMHSAESIGGRLADDILSTPGLYVSLVDCPTDDTEPDGWAVAFKSLETGCTCDPCASCRQRHTCCCPECDFCITLKEERH